MDSNKITDELENLTSAEPEQRSPLFHIVAAVIIIAIAGGLAWYYLKTPVKTKPRTHHAIAPLIEVQQVHRTSVAYSFQAMGIVEADTFVELKPQVTGPLLSVNAQFTPGGFLQQGEIVATIDPGEYQLVLDQMEGEEAQAEAKLNLEMGRQLVAEKEFELLGKEVSAKEKELMLRIPQMNAALATLQAAQAKKRLAADNLAQTRICAPFAAITLRKNVDCGSRVTPQTTIGSLVGTERFRIRIAIPRQQLQWIRITDTPSTIRIRQGKQQRSGIITHISSELEEGSRMAVIYAMVDDPLSLKPENSDKPQLLLGSLVETEIIGARLEDVVAIDRSQLATENSVFILDKDGHPSLRQVEIIARNRHQVFITDGITEGDTIVTAGLTSLKKAQQKKQRAHNGQ